MANGGPPLLGLLGIGEDNRVPARVDLHDDLNLVAVVDRLELGGILFLGQLVILGLLTNLPTTAQVGIAGLVVIALDLFDRKLLTKYLD
ncbi:hypothetical protein HWV23_06195 [Natronomonas halophila]|uniref:hypothetical protein n=1 Tax=Natronomonas halophila TaxID=2747817 RepID=UPI0015B5FC95|nr:hypothetical protein [Natronomonas halophila]QLD85334.1 hypothetical protein HWV23_06195 [Natronomonas halophila]